MNNTKEIKKFIKNHKQLFWYIKPDELGNISSDYLVEAILNYGTRKDVIKLIELLGIEKVADIFYRNTSGTRTNYRKKVINFFNLYFEYNSQRNPYRKTGRTASFNKKLF